LEQEEHIFSLPELEQLATFSLFYVSFQLLRLLDPRLHHQPFLTNFFLFVLQLEFFPQLPEL
jgi:hypothetical protein